MRKRDLGLAALLLAVALGAWWSHRYLGRWWGWDPKEIGGICVLAWAGVQWQRKELVWVVYGIMIVAAWKLATRDFPQEHNLSLVISLLCYGGALMILPRIVQRRPRANQSRSATAAS